jgi:hypothetical protein
MAGAGEGPTLPVNCGGCGRAADACPRCGWEWTGLPRGQRLSRRGSCISCQVLEIAGTRQQERRASGQMPRAFATTFDSTRARSRLLQRLADASEGAAESRYRCFRLFADVATTASRRAEAVARLEARLRGLHEDANPLRATR